MGALSIDLQCEVDDLGYELRGKGEQRAIVRRGTGTASLRSARPLEAHPNLFAHFCQMPAKPESYLIFAAQHGFLHGGQSGGSTHDAERISVWMDEQSKMRPAFDAWMRFQEAPKHLATQRLRAFLDAFENSFIGNRMLFWSLIPHPSATRPALRIRTHTFSTGLWLQFGLAASEERNLHACDWCGQWFTRGGRGGKAIARFCSNKCRDSFHNAAKKRAKS